MFAGSVATQAVRQPKSRPREQGVEQSAADAVIAVFGSHPDLVDPELGRLVGVDVMDRGRHAHHQSLVGDDGDGQVMPRVGEELGRPTGIDGVVEYAV